MPRVDLPGLLDRTPRPLRPLVDVGQRCAVRFIELEVFDRAMALAGQACAARPQDGRDVADKLIEEFKLSGSAADALRGALTQPPGPESSLSILSFLILAISALSFTRAMQRMYVRTWRLEPMGIRGNVWGLAWLAAFIAWGSLQPLIVSVFDGVLAFVVSEALATLLWLLTPWLLVGRRLPWRTLVLQAVLTAAGLLALSVSAAIYAPRAVSSAAADFGVIGVAFALLTLLFCVMFVFVTAAAVGATLAEWRAERRS